MVRQFIEDYLRIQATLVSSGLVISFGSKFKNHFDLASWKRIKHYYVTDGLMETMSVLIVSLQSQHEGSGCIYIPLLECTIGQVDEYNFTS